MVNASFHGHYNFHCFIIIIIIIYGVSYLQTSHKDFIFYIYDISKNGPSGWLSFCGIGCPLQSNCWSVGARHNIFVNRNVRFKVQI